MSFVRVLIVRSKSQHALEVSEVQFSAGESLSTPPFVLGSLFHGFLSRTDRSCCDCCLIRESIVEEIPFPECIFGQFIDMKAEIYC